MRLGKYNSIDPVILHADKYVSEKLNKELKMSGVVKLTDPNSRRVNNQTCKMIAYAVGTGCLKIIERLFGVIYLST